MSFLMPSVGETRLLELVVGASEPSALTLHLFSNDILPSSTDTASSYVELNGGGYSAKRLLPQNWLISDGSAEYPPQEFLFSGIPPVPFIFGYYVLNGDTLFWAERFPVSTNPPFKPPFVITGLGDKVIVTPVFSLVPA